MLEHVRTCWNTFPGGEFSTSKNLVEYGGDISKSKSSPILPLPHLTPPPPPPSPFPLSLGGGRGGGGGKGRGEGRGRGGTIAPPPRRGGDEVPLPSPSGFEWLFSLSLSSLCVIYPRGRSVHSSKLLNLWCPLNKIHCGILQKMKFKSPPKIFLSLNISSLCGGPDDLMLI